MTCFINQGTLFVLVALAAFSLVAVCSTRTISFRLTTNVYQRYWDDQIKFLGLPPLWRLIPLMQIALLAISITVFVLTKCNRVLFAIPFAILPLLVLKRAQKHRAAAFESQLDTFLTSLADTLTAVPNLTEALSSLHEHLTSPIRDEVGTVLAEVRLGSTVEEALRRMASRNALPGLDAAVEAALLSYRIGGDLSFTLRRIATSVREMARLEGVIKTKTAEGRSQAWVMGAVPPGMMLVLEKVDPEWLDPLWSDPIGWVILGVAAIFEVSAIAMIRRIMAVDI